MKVRNIGKSDEKVGLMMTPMIDIVFQLLIFFIMTFKIVAPEGDFNIKMPSTAPKKSEVSDELPPIKVRLSAASSGQLASISLGDRRLGTFADLRREIREMVRDSAGPGSEFEVELDFDYNLRFEYVIDAITSVSGYIQADGQVAKLIERIKFSPLKKPD